MKECPVLGNPVDHGSFFPLEQEWGTDTRALDRPQLEKNMMDESTGRARLVHATIARVKFWYPLVNCHTTMENHHFVAG